ncbi:MAG: DUF928 domain-containing protein [Leptolyngbyaceae cyanobacterium]
MSQPGIVISDYVLTALATVQRRFWSPFRTRGYEYMKRLSNLFTFSIALLTVAGLEVNAALQPTTIAPAFESTGDLLVANRLRNRGLRFRVSSSAFRRGGFSRGTCPVGAAPVMPVIEGETAAVETAPAYMTASAHPTFFIQVPETEGYGVFFIEDLSLEGDNPQLYEAEFDLTGEAGIIGIRVPDEAQALQVGSNYRWRATIFCGSGEEEEEDTILILGGEIERVADVEGTPEERLEQYLDAGIWQETATILAEYRYTDPSTATDEDWAILMEESGIPQFANEPIVDIVESRLMEE